MADFIEPVQSNHEVKVTTKRMFINLLRELFAAESNDRWKHTADPSKQGLTVLGRFPVARDQLPIVTVSLAGWRFKPLTP